MRRLTLLSLCILALLFTACGSESSGGADNSGDSDSPVGLAEVPTEDLIEMFEAEEVEATLITDENSASNGGEVLEIEIVGPAVIKSPFYRGDRLASHAAIYIYEKTNAEVWQEASTIEISLLTHPDRSTIDTYTYPVEDVKTEVACKKVTDEYTQARLSGDSAAIFRSFDQMYIPDSMVSANLANLQRNFGEYQGGEFEGTGIRKKLPDGTDTAEMYYVDTYAKGRLRTRYVVSTGPQLFLITGFATGRMKEDGPRTP